MSYSLDRDEKSDRGDTSHEVCIPEGVFKGIEDIENGDTASKADLESVLKF